MKPQTLLLWLFSMLQSPHRLIGFTELFLFRINSSTSTPQQFSLIFLNQMSFIRGTIINHKPQLFSGRNHEKVDYSNSVTCAMSL
jgi:hypothetical protein